MCSYDEAGSIGKRYRRQDAIGTPFSITIDDNTINNNTVTIRDRDTMEQITLELDKVIPYIEEKLSFNTILYSRPSTLGLFSCIFLNFMI